MRRQRLIYSVKLLLLCAVTGRVFEPVGLMKRDLDVQAQIGVELMAGPNSDLRVYFISTHRRCLVFAFMLGLHSPRIPLTHPHPALQLHPQPHSPMHPPLLWQTPHHPYLALHSLTPQSRLSTQLTPASSSLPPLQPHPYGELTPALRASHSQATTKRDFGPASSAWNQNDRVNALLLPSVVGCDSFWLRRARFASVGDNWWWPDETRLSRAHVCEYGGKRVTML